jgi:hypothetical protein
LATRKGSKSEKEIYEENCQFFAVIGFLVIVYTVAYTFYLWKRLNAYWWPWSVILIALLTIVWFSFMLAVANNYPGDNKDKKNNDQNSYLE